MNKPEYFTTEQINIGLAKRAWSHFYIPNFLRNRKTCYQPLFDLCADDVVWKHEGPDNSRVPSYPGEIHGKQALINLLTVEDLEAVDDNDLEDPVGKPLEFYGNGNRVVMLLEERYLINKTGVTVRNNHVAIVMDFHEGLITRLRLIGNMSDYIEAFLGGVGWSTSS